MANEIYLLTHSGLSDLVSSRAASQVLDKALKEQGHTRNSVSGDQMRRILVGPIATELKGILPKEGVERSLQQIIKSLRQQQAATRAVSGDSLSSDSDGRSQQPAVAVIEPDSHEPDIISGQSSAPATEAVLSKSQAQPAPRQALQVTSEAQLDKVVLAFAQVEHAKMVAAVRANGMVISSRGSGYDVDAVARLGIMGLKLLGRKGVIRSYYLLHSQAQLFLFPLGEYAVIMIGTSELNLGEVFATLSTLEEEL